MELAQKTCVQPQTRSNTAMATGSVQPFWSGPATGSDGEGCPIGREVVVLRHRSAAGDGV